MSGAETLELRDVARQYRPFAEVRATTRSPTADEMSGEIALAVEIVGVVGDVSSFGAFVAAFFQVVLSARQLRAAERDRANTTSGAPVHRCVVVQAASGDRVEVSGMTERQLGEFLRGLMGPGSAAERGQE